MKDSTRGKKIGDETATEVGDETAMTHFPCILISLYCLSQGQNTHILEGHGHSEAAK